MIPSGETSQDALVKKHVRNDEGLSRAVAVRVKKRESRKLLLNVICV